MNHKYLTDNPEVFATVDAPLDYEVEEGVLIDYTERTATKTDRELHRDEAKAGRLPSSDELRMEEAEWAARSGPVYIKRAQVGLRERN